MNLPKVYEPKEYESDIYALWERSEAFVPVARGSKETYSIVIPPPNANGNLHIGHALTLAIEDIAIRYHRMKGEKTLFLPGADHAGFETQVVYERELDKKGKSRFDFSRESLYQQIWDFVAQNKDNYETQFRRIGASLDWTRYVFALDDKIVNRAYETFKHLWNDGLIYRGERLVNFCTFHGTAFADIEVEHKEVKGNLWYLRYPLTDGTGEIIVATTRPETMLGDTAVAVHPDDARYRVYIGKTVKLPLTGREVPIVADEFVDKEFGTGAVKITPAHDPNDFEAAERHALPKIEAIDHEGKMTANVPEKYRNLPSAEARTMVVADLEAGGFLLKVEEMVHNVGHCYKCGTVIEPLLREQWFINMQPLAARAIDALEAGKVTFQPEVKKQHLITYLKNLRDWNISRQIAWGIPIPAFQNVDEPDDWVYDERTDQEIIEINGKTYHRDPDVFDTWFSSGSWPYATLDYPNGADFNDFYPLSVMETGADILFPWVSRMLMLGLYVTGDVPFKHVYLHGLVLDEHGQKMSKSKGNVVNPMDILDEYGSDALRLGLTAGQTPGNNQPFSTSRVVAARNFCNKLWNIARYIETAVNEHNLHAAEPKPLTQADHWVLRKLQHSVEEMTAACEEYRFGEAYETLYHFVWDDFADWYIEASKAQPNEGLLAYCLSTILRIAHPFAPFVTETIWQTLQWQNDNLLAVSSWPKVYQGADESQVAAFEAVKGIVTETREMQQALNIHKATLEFADSPLIADNATLIARLAKLGEVKRAENNGTGLVLTETTEQCWLAVSKEVIAKYKDDLDKKLTEHEALIRQLEARLANTSYVERAPAPVVDQTRKSLAEAQQLAQNVQQALKRFSE